MGTMSLPLSMKVKPAEIFEEMPAGFRTYLSRGFGELAKVPVEKIDQLAVLISDGFEPSSEMALIHASELLNIPKDDVSTIAAALSLLIALTTRRTDIAVVLQYGVDAGVIPSESHKAVIAVTERLADKKDEYKEALEATSLAKEIVPSFERLDLTVDIRFSFEDEKIVRSVPVLLGYLHTDSPRNRSFFQIRQHELQRVIDQLTRALGQMEAVEKWTNERGR